MTADMNPVIEVIMTGWMLIGLGAVVSLGALPAAIRNYHIERTAKMKAAPKLEQQALDLLTYRQDDHETSIEAADKIENRLSDLMRSVHAVLIQYPSGLTDSELNTAMLRHDYPDAPEGTYRKRRTDLTTLGYVKWTGEKRANRHGNPQMIWVVIPDKPLPPA